jgi:preprotein translocase subunit SecA
MQLERLFDEPARLRQLLLRGLCFAIVDAADSVLIDDACTPRLISGGNNDCHLITPWLGMRMVRRAQRRAEHLHIRIRRELLQVDEHLEIALAFSGRSE